MKCCHIVIISHDNIICRPMVFLVTVYISLYTISMKIYRVAFPVGNTSDDFHYYV